MGWKIGQRVWATGTVTEGGATADRSAKFPDAGYIHAEAGDEGTVEYVDVDGYATVRFDRTRTATIVDGGEIRPV